MESVDLKAVKKTYKKAVDIELLKPAAYNPRTISDEEMKALTMNIKRFGLVDPIIARAQDNMIIGGHQRVKASQVLGIKKVPVMFLEISENDAKILNLALNRISGEFHLESLKPLLEEIMSRPGHDHELTGFRLEEITMVLNPKEPLEPPVPPLPVKAKAKLGEIYKLGRHRLMCGDSTKTGDVEILMQGQKADMVFTDPPYGVGYTGGAKKREKIKGDEPGTDIYSKALPVIKIASKSQAPLYLWYADTQVDIASSAVIYSGYDIKAQIIWVKNNAQFVTSALYKGKHELCLFCQLKNEKPSWNGGKNEVTVWEIDRASKNEYHPTQKPVDLPYRAIKNSSLIGNIVLDLFGGSGSTLIACEQLDRACYMMEIDPRYIDVIIKRWQDFTGEKAKLIDGAEIVESMK